LLSDEKAQTCIAARIVAKILLTLWARDCSV
jgi:hypothetical protein